MQEGTSSIYDRDFVVKNFARTEIRTHDLSTCIWLSYLFLKAFLSSSCSLIESGVNSFKKHSIPKAMCLFQGLN